MCVHVVYLVPYVDVLSINPPQTLLENGNITGNPFAFSYFQMNCLLENEF